ncbi:MAG: SPOR domain-containing protein [Chlorobiota bacterium]
MRNLILILWLSAFVVAQSKTPDIDSYLDMIAQGKIVEVKSHIPDLLVEYPNDPGVKLLLAVVIDDTHKSIDIFKKIVANHPESKWADDAYWRIIQYYALKGEINKAKYELNYFRTKYPQSEFVLAATEMIRIADGIASNKSTILESDNNTTIERKAAPVIRKDNDSQPNQMRDFSKEEPKKIGLVREREEPRVKEQPEVETNTVVKSQPVRIQKINNKNDNNLAISNNNHRVIRQRITIDETEDKTHPSQIVKEQEKIISSTKQNSEPVDIASADLEQAKEVTPPKQEEVAETVVTNTGYYGLQVGLFDNKKSANAEMKKFLRKRMRTEVKSKTIDGENKFAVVIGNYSSLESAKAAKIIVQQQCDCEPIVFEK